MKKFITIFLFTVTSVLFAENLTLETCYKLSKENYPTIKQLKNYQIIAQLRVSNLNTAYYPEIQLVGQAQYQSDVTKVELNFPTIIPGFKMPTLPEQKKDQYKIGFNINQLIWDGGIVSNQKDLELAQAELNKQNVETDLFSLKQRVNDAFFTTLLLQKKIKILEESKNDLTERLKTIKVKVDAGAILSTNASIISAEILKLEQNISELSASSQTMLQVLGELINKNLNDEITLEMPAISIENGKSKRPEFETFRLSKENLERTKSLVDSKNNPKFSAFVQAMYGRPGLNMFDNTFQPFYVAGLKASWNVWNWNTANRETQILDQQKEILTSQEEAFSKNLNIAGHKYLNDIERLMSAIDKDKQIIELRESIVSQVSNQLDNGAITSTEYISEFTQKSIAKLNLETHKIEMEQAKAAYYTLLGLE